MTASDTLPVGAAHVVKVTDPYANAEVSGSAVDNTAACPNYCWSGNSSSFQGIRNPSAVGPPLSWPLCESEKSVKTADCLLWMAKSRHSAPGSVEEANRRNCWPAVTGRTEAVTEKTGRPC